MSLGDFLWSLLVIYFMIFYFILLFRILGDLFGDRETSGLVKTVWIVLLIVFPFITMFTYLIIRGKGMTERSMAKMEAAQAAEEDYIRRTAATATTDDSTAKIARAQELLKSGAITQLEFDSIKAKALA